MTHLPAGKEGVHRLCFLDSLRGALRRSKPYSECRFRLVLVRTYYHTEDFKRNSERKKEFAPFCPNYPRGSDSVERGCVRRSACVILAEGIVITHYPATKQRIYEKIEQKIYE